MEINKEYRLKLTKQAEQIVSQMTLKEKFKLMGGKTSLIKMGIDFAGKGYNNKPYSAAGCKRLGVPELLFCDGPRGVVSGNSTCFPVSMLRGATFDPELEEKVGQAIGKETRANGGNYFAGVCINIPYNPAWGRSQESYGEDTVHLGKMAVSLVKGVQSKNVMACAKHYAFNSMENSRFKVNVTCSKRTEREIYLPHFKKCVDAGVASVMGAYNLYNGDHCCESKYLLTNVLRNDWGFDGFVISDFCFGVHDTKKAANSGMDIEMCNTNKFKVSKLKKLLKEGEFTENQLDEIILRIIRTILAFTKAPDTEAFTKGLILCKEHTNLAREVANKGITLLKNDGILPFDNNVKNIAIVGDLAKVENIGDHGSSRTRSPYTITFIDAMEKEYPNVNFTYIPTADVANKSDIIKKSDKVVLFAGYRHNDEGEFVNPYGKANGKFGGDRLSLGIYPEETDMIKKASEWNKNSVVVLIGGNMIRVSEWIDNVPGVLMAFYPGLEGGYAIADIIFGKVNPSGKLPYVTTLRDKDLPSVKWDTEAQFYEYYHGYRKTDKDIIQTQFPYGYGLSYTQFALTDIKYAGAMNDKAKFTLTVKNTGKIEGGEVLQIYIGYPGSGVERPIKTLADFKKVYLKPSESKTVELLVNKEDISYYDENINRLVYESLEYVAYIGTDSDNAMKNSISFRF